LTTQTSINQGRWRLWALWALVLAMALVSGPQTWALLHFQPAGFDFLPLWTAGRMAWTAPARVYDFAAVTGAQGWLLGHLRWLRPYAYPPSALLILAPFGRLPFWIALALWDALGLAVFLAAGARLAKSGRGLTLALMTLAPPVVLALAIGQTVLLAAGLATLAVTELKARPRLAGALFALAAALKPQAVLLAPVALVACGAYEALASAAVVGTLVLAVSAMLFGPARWSEWLASLAPFQALTEQVPRLMMGMITPYAAGRLLGLAGVSLMIWRAAFAAFGVVAVWWAFRRQDEPARRLAALLGGGLMITPYAMHYDGSLLVPAAAAMAVGGVREGGWILRLLALGAVCAVTTPYLGAPCVTAFILLTALEPPTPRVAAAKGLS
jgi:hypothetical protein